MPETPWSRKLPPSGSNPGAASPPQPGSVSPRASEPPARPADNLSGRSIQSPGAVRPSQLPTKTLSSGRSRVSGFDSKKIGLAVVAFLSIIAIGFFVVVNSDRDILTTQTTIGSDNSTPTSVDTATTISEINGDVDWDKLSKSVVFIEALSPCDWRGSGTISTLLRVESAT